MPIADAVRCSMSIHMFFVPHQEFIKMPGEERRVVENSHQYFDGGSLDNYLLGRFNKNKYVFPSHDKEWIMRYGEESVTNPRAIGFRLVSPELHAVYENGASMPQHSTISDMNFLIGILESISTFTNQENQHASDLDQRRRTVYINTHQVGTVDFDITEENKELLIRSGREAADCFYTRQSELMPSHHRIPVFLKEYFLLDPLKRHPSGFVIPDDLDEKFNKIIKIACAVSVESLRRVLTVLGVDPSIQDTKGNTLSHRAAISGDIALLKKLYIICSNFNIKNYAGRTVLDCAAYCENSEKRASILEFLHSRPGVAMTDQCIETAQDNHERMVLRR
jgi:hypothetical protein